MAYISFQPSDYFNTIIYSGTGGNGTTTSQAITGAGFQPDWVWLKQRTSTQRHQICDVLRGTNQIIGTDRDGGNVADSDIINSFDSDGFTAGYQDQANDTGQTYVSWLWKAGGAGSSNSNGSITSTVSASATSGFSIVTWTGTGSNATIGHGLSSTPKMIYMKRRDTSAGWIVYHEGIGAGKYLRLNTSDHEASDSNIFNNTAPTSSVFSVGTDTDNNGSGGTYIAYCFAEIKGYCRIGDYLGNSSSTNFIYTGFKPAYVIIKQAFNGDANEVWGIRDNKRNAFNPVSRHLVANSQSSESLTSSHFVDFLSNGFNIRTSSENALNTNYGYIYMAIAEHPIVSSNGVPATAR